MKRCTACEEEFEDKFSFGPGDGTPLNCLAAALKGPPKHDDSESTMQVRRFPHLLSEKRQWEESRAFRRGSRYRLERTSRL